MKRSVILLALPLLFGAMACEDGNDDYVKTQKGELIRREDAQDRGVSAPAASDSGSGDAHDDRPED